MSNGLTVAVKRADIPEALLKHVKLDLASGRIGSTWTEVAGWDSCKLLARKQGAVTRYAHRHYGYYDCCRKAEVEAAGCATEGTSYTELPIWALTLWIAMRTSAKEYIEIGYDVPETRVKITRWERNTLDRITVHFVERETGTIWHAQIVRGDIAPNFRFSRFFGGTIVDEMGSAA